MNTDNLIRLSQTHLTLLETCPPQFQTVFIEQLTIPSSPEQQEKMNWGSQFHLLMQQQALGLSVESLKLEDEQLIQSVQALILETASLWENDTLQREAEHHRSLRVENYLLTVVYDLLILEAHKAQIFDWKTYPEPEKKDKLINNWQTRLYPYILVETSDYLPEQISMTYWFVKLPQKPQSMTFFYNSQQHEKNHRDLHTLFAQLNHYLTQYDRNHLPFPHHLDCKERCPYAKFRSNLESENPSYQSLLEVLETVEEIPITQGIGNRQ